MRECSKCGESKRMDNFVKKSGRCHTCRKEKAKLYNAASKDKRRAYYIKNRESILQKCAEYTKNNAERRREYGLEYRKKHRERLTNRQVSYERDRIRRDPFFKLKINLRHCIVNALKSKGYTKNARSCELLGANYATVQAHLIATAISNYGAYDPTLTYHTDHIVPNASAETEEELIKLQHYTNLQLLYPKDNLMKGSKIMDADLSQVIALKGKK
tara:strand:+ start:498 stop:1142 length:645 start_codon:yes stop_codon:yes gene_type:complete